MKKTFSLTIEFTCRINESGEWPGTINESDYSKRFLEELFRDKRAILDYYKLQFLNGCPVHFDDYDLLVRHLGIRDIKEIFIPLTHQIPTVAARYIRQLYTTEPREPTAWQEWEQGRQSMENRLGTLRIKAMRFEEIKE